VEIEYGNRKCMYVEIGNVCKGGNRIWNDNISYRIAGGAGIT
jgi:hypothetical protein